MRTISGVLPGLYLGVIFGQTTPLASNHERARGFLEEFLKDKNPDTRKHAVQALGLVSAREPYLSELEAMLSPDRDPAVPVALEHALPDKDWSVRAHALHEIALRNDPGLESKMVPLFEYKEQAGRVRAAAGSLRLQPIRSAPARKNSTAG